MGKCANAPECVDGWIECWYPGGICPDPNDPSCELCGPCLDCRSRNTRADLLWWYQSSEKLTRGLIP